MGNWPGMILRLTKAFDDCEGVFRRIMELLARHPGSADEIWLCAPSYASPGRVRESFRHAGRLRELCRRHGIRCSFQQGTTLGHGAIDPIRLDDDGVWRFAEEDFSVASDGRRLTGILCPRSPNVQAFAYEYAKAVMETLRPDSYWLDDDLRMGISKPNCCFCERCLAAFGKRQGQTFTREELSERLYGGEVSDELREAWGAFNAESLALYGAQTRRAADEVLPSCRLGYQAVWAGTFHTGLDYGPLLWALSGEGRQEVGIRPGAGHYNEEAPRGMVHKCLSIAREAARCRRTGVVAQVAYEQENYTRQVLHKTPEAMMVESALALASGCDSLSEYYYDSRRHEPLDYLEDFLAEVAAWRPYLERLSVSTRRTRLGGVARHVGDWAFRHRSFTQDDEWDDRLALAGIPVTVSDDGPDVRYLTLKSVECLSEDDTLFARPLVLPADAFDALRSSRPELLEEQAPLAVAARERLEEALRNAELIELDGAGRECRRVSLRAGDVVSAAEVPSAELCCGVVVVPAMSGVRVALTQRLVAYPTAWQRRALLEALDAVSPDFPVRLETCQAVRVLPRVLPDGRVDSVTLLNLSIGRTRPLELRVRGGVVGEPLLLRPCEASERLASRPGEREGEVVLTLPRLSGWGVATVWFGEV